MRVRLRVWAGLGVGGTESVGGARSVWAGPDVCRRGCVWSGLKVGRAGVIGGARGLGGANAEGAFP